jgi:hypothetical protein
MCTQEDVEPSWRGRFPLLISMFLLPLAACGQIALEPVGFFNPGGAEIAAYDPATKRLFSISGSTRRIDAIDISDPASPTLAFRFGDFEVGPTSIALHGGVLAVAVPAADVTKPGAIHFFDTGGGLKAVVAVGSLPDMTTFTPDGKRLLVANEGEPSPDYLVDPEGSVSIIDMTRGVENLTPASVTSVSLSDAVPKINADSIRVFGPGATLARDAEPEYIAVSPDSSTAWVTLQENNAVAVLDISAARFTSVAGLGFKDHSRRGNGLDASDRDGGIHIRRWPVLGLYQPDGVVAFETGGRLYLLMANEGESRPYQGFNEEIRVGDENYRLDPSVFANAAGLKQERNLGRLVVSNATGDIDGDGDFDRIHSFGGRSFSIRDSAGRLIHDSGDEFERIIARQSPRTFNSNGEPDTFDQRSPNMGPEPEGVAIGEVSGLTYAFIGLERAGGVMVYDVSNPRRAKFVQYVTTDGDVSPEGLAFIGASDSPTGVPLLVVSHEISGTIRIFEVRAPGQKRR